MDTTRDFEDLMRDEIEMLRKRIGVLEEKISGDFYIEKARVRLVEKAKPYIINPTPEKRISMKTSRKGG